MLKHVERAASDHRTEQRNGSCAAHITRVFHITVNHSSVRTSLIQQLIG